MRMDFLCGVRQLAAALKGAGKLTHSTLRPIAIFVISYPAQLARHALFVPANRAFSHSRPLIPSANYVEDIEYKFPGQAMHHSNP